MSEDRCPACGTPRPAADPAEPESRSAYLVCNHGVSGAGPAAGAATLFQPQLLADEVFARLLERGPEVLAAETIGVHGLEGTRLISEPEACPTFAPVIRGQLRLREESGEGGQLFQLKERTDVGRRGAIRIDDETLSGRHFEIELAEERFVLRDLRSSNGTFLNGCRVATGELEAGDEIRAGRSTFTFTVVSVIPV